MREYYDLWDALQRGLGRDGRTKESVRRALDPRAPIATCSRATSRGCSSSRARFSSGWRCGRSCASTVLYPPAPQRPYRCDGYGRLRVHGVAAHAAQARRPAHRGARAARRQPASAPSIAGEGEERARARGAGRAARARRSRDARRPPLATSSSLDHLARCRAVCFPPFDEDYGFVTAEAFASRKAVITCRDSGGPAELVDDGVSGIRLRPDAGSAGRGAAARDGGRRRGRAAWERAALAAGARLDLGRLTVQDC